MIKNSVLMLALALVVASCSLSKEVREQRKTINGTWLLEDVGYEGDGGSFKSMLFNDANGFCFEGSKWSFLENNSTGSYTIPTSNSICPGGARNIRWSVLENENGNDKLQFKFIDEKKKDLYGRTGYRLEILSLSDSQMRLKSDVNVDGSPVSVIYNFVKQ
ncbi:Lipocalin-like domain-containing protein [Zobellia uliginosa]|uniref:Lipocalin-like domain-containing protein n=1 Tax=Zobellia uliginosa TaxID=143224 RepID=A0ABY1KSF2_9FLAO|nr:lipocalin family protein [Zobellia uliginosa]SIS70698.1 Lipocalin-like domain-containing protein [Zobellia uliginosa]